MKRKIVQIAASKGHEGAVLFALAEDGTAWQQPDRFSKWERLPPLPDADEEVGR